MNKYNKPSSQSRGNGGGGGAGRFMLPLILIALLGGAIYWGYGYWQGQTLRETDAQTGCLKNSPTPHAVLFMVDATDRLSQENARRIGSRIKDEVDSLERYSRVIIVPFGGDTATPLVPIFNGCVPGRASDARWDEGAQLLQPQYEQFRQEVDGLVSRLQSLPDSRTSPISEQVVRAASDTQLHWSGNARTLVLVTDGLESSIYWTRNLRLPDPPVDVLRDVRAEYFEIGNTRGNRLQTREMRLEWKSWLERAGAAARITAPGFSANPQ